MNLRPLVLLLATCSTGACTVLNNMDGYSGGARDTGTIAVDSTAPDTAQPDTAQPDTAQPDTTVAADTFETAAVDSTTDAADAGDSSTVDTLDTAVVDTGSVADTSDALIPDAPVGCHIVINEVQTRSVATGVDEFIELFNPCDVEIDASLYRVAYRSSSGMTETLVGTLPAGTKIATKGFYLLANGGSTFAATANLTFSAGLADDGGLGLRDSAGTLYDAVAWGTVAAAHPFLEGAAAPSPTSGGSISRVPNGLDTNSNSADFKKLGPATPKS